MPISHLLNFYVEYPGKVLKQNQSSVKVEKKRYIKCFGIRESLRNCKHFICKTCSTIAETDDLFPMCVTIDGDEFEATSEFYYPGDVIG